MIEELATYFLLYISSAIKFIFGPIIGVAQGYSVFATGTLTMFGMMTSVYIFTFFGTWIKEKSKSWIPKKKGKLFTKSRRRNVGIWLKYGVLGLAFLTPILLTPIGGTVIANAFGGKRQDIIKYMWLSSFFWSYLITWVMKFATHLVPFLNLV